MLRVHIRKLIPEQSHAESGRSEDFHDFADESVVVIDWNVRLEAGVREVLLWRDMNCPVLVFSQYSVHRVPARIKHVRVDGRSLDQITNPRFLSDFLSTTRTFADGILFVEELAYVWMEIVHEDLQGLIGTIYSYRRWIGVVV